ncbi:polysaccharide biosynthesis tyrosine autokinase [Planctomicrobium sp. SH664]|uniref:polysaccharide biosynthesis tyrosine autokinase n=1 Tax=Planctomicrobium sp. SH664 TaxID=3448125 RepID=UPI003F5C5E29
MISESAQDKPAPFRGQNSHANGIQSLDLVQTVRRQFWLLAACTALGMFLSVLYWAFAQDWYESRAKMLVTVKDPGLASKEGMKAVGQAEVQDDVLANHMEIVSSRFLIGKALERGHFAELPSIASHLTPDSDAIDYIRGNLSLTKGGEGVARNARTLNVALRHTDPQDAQKVLQALVYEYEGFLDDQVSRVMGEANRLILEARSQVERDLKEAETKYIEARRNAPVIFQGDGSSNVFLEKFRRFETELVDVEIQRSAISTRLQKVQDALNNVNDNEGIQEKLALIDTDSLDRLGTFAGLQVNAAQSAEFVASQPIRMQEAVAKTQGLLELQSQKQKLESNFGPGHPEVANLEGQIKLLERMINNTREETAISNVFGSLTPELLLSSYVGFLKHDLASLDEKKAKLTALASVAEQESKKLVEFELQDRMLKADIDRRQGLYDGIVDQLRNLDTASGLSGYIHEVLESPRLGKRVWPKLSICLLGGMLLGLTGGLGLGLVNDQVDARFRSPAEITESTGIPVVGQIGHIRKARGKKGAERFVVDPQAPEAESFRLLRTYLLRDVKSGRLKRLSVTSCQTKDGKSTIVANTGVMFADAGIRTLIVDGDMRAPTVHRFFDMQNQVGLSDLLQGKLDLDAAIQSPGIDGLHIIPAGTPVRNPAELLQSEAFDELLTTLESQFDLVIVDSGPILWVSDPAIIAQKCKATFLVIRSSTDTRRQVQEAARRLQTAEVEVPGCIINTYGSSKEFTRDNGYASPYHYYYSGYYRGYGHRVEEAAEAAKKEQSNGSHS